MSSETAGRSIDERRRRLSFAECNSRRNETLCAPRPTSRVDRNSTHAPKHRVASPLTTLSAHGAPLVWLTGGALATALAMIVGLLVFILYQGLQTFWPLPLRELKVVADTVGDSATDDHISWRNHSQPNGIVPNARRFERIGAEFAGAVCQSPGRNEGARRTIAQAIDLDRPHRHAGFCR